MTRRMVAWMDGMDDIDVETGAVKKPRKGYMGGWGMSMGR